MMNTPIAELRKKLTAGTVGSLGIEQEIRAVEAEQARARLIVEHRDGQPLASEARLDEQLEVRLAELRQVHAAAEAAEAHARSVERAKYEKRAHEADVARAMFAGYQPSYGGQQSEARGGLLDLVEGRIGQLSLEARAMTTGGSGTGAEVITTKLASAFYEILGSRSALFAAARKIETGEDISPIQVPILATVGAGDQERAEGSTITADDAGLDEVTLGAYSYAGIQLASNQLLASSSVSVQDVVVKALARRLVDSYRARLAVGTGSSQPQGITVGAGAGVTAASATAVTADELVDLVHSVSPESRDTRTSAFVMADSTWQTIRKLKASDGLYLVGDLGNGAALELLGYRVIIDQAMPAMTTGLRPIVFGAISEAFMVRTTDVRIESSVDAGWETDQTSFRAVQWLDAKVVDASAIRALTMA